MENSKDIFMELYKILKMHFLNKICKMKAVIVKKLLYYLML